MHDALTDDEARRLLDAALTRVHGNGNPYRRRDRDACVLRRMLEAGASLDDLCAGGEMAIGLSRRSVARLVAGYARRARIRRPVTPTTLRRTFALQHWTRFRSLTLLASALGLKSPASATAYLSTDFAGHVAASA